MPERFNSTSIIIIPFSDYEPILENNDNNCLFSLKMRETRRKHMAPNTEPYTQEEFIKMGSEHLRELIVLAKPFPPRLDDLQKN